MTDLLLFLKCKIIFYTIIYKKNVIDHISKDGLRIHAILISLFFLRSRKTNSTGHAQLSMHQKALLSVLLVTYTRRIFRHGSAGIVSWAMILKNELLITQRIFLSRNYSS